MDAAAILGDAPDAIVAVDSLDRITYWNRGAHELLGYSAADAIGQSLTSLIVPLKHREKHLNGFSRVMAGEASKYGRRDLLRVPALCKDGSKVAVEFTLMLVSDSDGRPSSSVAFMRDVSVTSSTIRKLRERIADPIGNANTFGKSSCKFIGAIPGSFRQETFSVQRERKAQNQHRLDKNYIMEEVLQKAIDRIGAHEDPEGPVKGGDDMTVRVWTRVERFGWRAIESFESFTSEFGQNFC